jgi:hypothetical protein
MTGRCRDCAWGACSTPACLPRPPCLHPHFASPVIFKCDKTEDDDSFSTKDDKMCSMILDANACDDKDE